jgi:hypothetical protein
LRNPGGPPGESEGAVCGRTKPAATTPIRGNRLLWSAEVAIDSIATQQIAALPNNRIAENADYIPINSAIFKIGQANRSLAASQ